MLIEYYKPRSLSAKRLDKYLAAGWFRSSNGLFRNKILCLGGDLCSVLNIRLKLDEFRMSKSLRRLRNKNAHLQVEIGPLSICGEMEDLYDLTKDRFKGFIFPDLYSFLFDLQNRGVFNSYHVKVYDNGQLVAASIFDKGERSVMSVLGLHEPQLKALSLGRYTMLQEVLFALDQGLDFYYPGYILKEKSDFDYKLRLGKYQYLNDNNRWVDMDRFDHGPGPAESIKRKSKALGEEFRKLGIPHKQLLYKLFSLGYAYPDGTFLKQPLIYVLPELSSNPFKITVAAYDLESEDYKLTYPIPIQDNYLSENQSDEFKNSSVYYDMILQDHEEEEYHFATAAELSRFVHKKIEEQSRLPLRQLFTPKG